MKRFACFRSAPPSLKRSAPSSKLRARRISSSALAIAAGVFSLFASSGALAASKVLLHVSTDKPDFFSPEDVYVDLDETDRSIVALHTSGDLDHPVFLSAFVRAPEYKVVLKRKWNVPIVKASLRKGFSAHTGGDADLFFRWNIPGTSWKKFPVSLFLAPNGDWRVRHFDIEVNRIIIVFNGRSTPRSLEVE